MIATMGSIAFKAPEWQLEKAEANEIAKATANVARHYPLKVAQKAIDWAHLGIALGAATVPRCYLTYARLQEERDARMKRANPSPQPFDTFQQQG